MKVKMTFGKNAIKPKREEKKISSTKKEVKESSIEPKVKVGKEVEKTNFDKTNMCKQESFFFKKTVDKSLTVIIVEDTEETVKKREELLKIINMRVRSDVICIVRYGNTVSIEKVQENNEFNRNNVFSRQKQNSDTVCFFDAIKIVESIAEVCKYKVYEENGWEKKKIQSIDIIGIGTGKEYGSKTDFTQAIKSLNKINEKNIETKYFCLEDTYLSGLASLGFRSVGIFHKINHDVTEG